MAAKQVLFGDDARAKIVNGVNILAMGPKKAREVLLLGETMSGIEAARIGLVNKAVPASELEAAGEDWAERIVRLPRHGASCPVGMAVSCSADRQIMDEAPQPRSARHRRTS